MGRLKWTQISVSFHSLWNELFLSPVHLDSALSRRKPEEKSALATIIRPILLQPVSLSRLLGFHLRKEEPWILTSDEKSHWETIYRLAEELWHRGEGLKLPLSIEEDFPLEMRQEWAKTWGKEKVASLALALGAQPPLSIRVRRSLKTQDVMAELSRELEQSIEWLKEGLSPVGLSIKGYSPILNTETFRSGAFEIQDEGSQLMALFALWPDRVAPLLQNSPGVSSAEQKIKPVLDRTLPRGKGSRTVIDACAGAGGKTLALADLMENSGRVFGYDVSEKKLLALKKRGRRAGYNNIQTIALTEGNETETIQPFFGKADVVLVDSPCSGWGVLRRNPDLKWRQRPEELERLKILQKRLLDLYSPLVAPGGRLVYGVCTFRKDETLDVVAEFSDSHPNFRKGMGGFLGPQFSTDGFFMQEWVREAGS